MHRYHYDAARAKMRMRKAANAYNSLIEEIGQVYFEANDASDVMAVKKKIEALMPEMQSLLDKYGR